jgi:hypothetical protein
VWLIAWFAPRRCIGTAVCSAGSELGRKHLGRPGSPERTVMKSTAVECNCVWRVEKGISARSEERAFLLALQLVFCSERIFKGDSHADHSFAALERLGLSAGPPASRPSSCAPCRSASPSRCPRDSDGPPSPPHSAGNQTWTTRATITISIRPSARARPTSDSDAKFARRGHGAVGASGRSMTI